MKVILLRNIPKLGKKDEVVEVSQGYAANALFPQRLAIPAIDAAILKVKQQHQNAAADKEIRRNLLDRAIAAVNGEALTMTAPANDQGNLFSKIDSEDIASFLDSHRISVDAKCISIPEGVIKKTGTYDIAIKDGEYQATVSISIRAK